MRKRTLIVLVVIAVLGLAVGWGLLRWMQGETPTAVAREGVLTQRLAATGRVEGWRQADLSSKVPGRIEAYLAEEGTDVPGGAVLARLDQAEMTAQVREAESALRQAERDLLRTRDLHAKGMIARQEAETAETRRDRARETLRALKAQLAHTVIRAPFAGRVVKKYKEAGETVLTLGPPEPLLRLADVRRLKIRAEVDESDAGKVAVGQRAEVTAEAYPGVTFSGEVAAVGHAVGRKRLRSDDPREILDAKVLEVEVALPADERLKVGMTVDLAIPWEGGKGLVVPLAAVRETGGEAWVKVRSEGGWERRKVRLGARTPVEVLVLDGLQKGDRVALAPDG